MKIRALTFFYDPAYHDHTSAMIAFAEYAKRFVKELHSIDYKIESLRLATTPFPEWFPYQDHKTAVERVAFFEKMIADFGFDFLSLGPALPAQPESYSVIPGVFGATSSVFMTGLMTRPGSRIDFDAVRACANVIHETARIRSDGFDNLRFSALGNVPPFSAYFPSAYAQPGPDLGVGIAIESADLALEVFSSAGSLEDARVTLLHRLHEFTRQIEACVSRVVLDTPVIFHGFDISLAPYPTPECSLGTALERLGIPALGLAGSLAASAFVTSTLDMGQWKKTGFNGLMIPILEDSGLGQRAAEGVLTIKDLVMLSAVCGTGLDTVPLPGDVTIEQLTAILLDIATLSQRLDKALTARLMPLPGKKPGDIAEFDFEYFAKAGVMSLEAEPLTNLFASEHTFYVPPRIR